MAFQIIRNDITKVHADAIVNTANPEPIYGGGTDTAIYQAAGEEKLLAARKEIGEIAPGNAAYTPAFDLNAKYIIHTVGPVWEGGNQDEFKILASCYRNSLELARKLNCESAAFPLISTGTYGFPKEKALEIATEEIKSFLNSLPDEEDMEITLVVFDRESFVLSGQVYDGVDAFIDGNYVEEKMRSEFMGAASHSLSSVEISVERGSNTSRRIFGNIFHKDSLEKKPKLRGTGKSKHAVKEDSFCPDADLEEACEEAYEECLEDISSEDVVFTKVCESPRSLDEVMSEIGETWQESLFRMIDEKGYTDAETYKKANVDRKLFSKIRSNPDYQPKKITAVAFALALELNLDETKDFLGRAGYAFSPSNRFDLIIEYFIQNGVYDTYTINLALFEHDQPLIGA